MASIRLAFACVAENRADWVARVFNLALSIRNRGGSAANAPIIACFVDGIDRRFQRLLNTLDVQIEVVEPFDLDVRYTNKLRMFEHLDNASSCDVLVALDCDVVVVADPAAAFDLTKKIRARPDDSMPLSDENWKKIYRELDISEPAKDCLLIGDGEPSYPYWNAGVVFIPMPLVDSFSSEWRATCRRILAMRKRDPDTLPRPTFTDQVGFACALLSQGTPFERLPVWGNLPTNYSVAPQYLEEPPREPVLVHYHRHVTGAGFLRRSGMANVDTALDELNRLRASMLGSSYKGLDSLEGPPTMLGRVEAAIQRQFRDQAWYRSPGARRIKSSLVNLKQRGKWN